MIGEEPLSGGTLTAGVVRVGDTVRRPAGGDRSFQHRLLIHLERVDFTEAPRFLGVDAQGRDILDYLEGSAGREGGCFSDQQISAAAALLRRFHDATAGSALAAPQEVACHNDWSPANAIFRAGMPVALIDFDLAAPGARIWDLAYSAMSWLDLGSARASSEQARRLRVMLDAYGGFEMTELAVNLIKRSEAVAHWAERHGRDADRDWALRCLAWTRQKFK